jgi:hypothetical protein
LVFVCFDWVSYTPGPIPAELGQLANLQELYLDRNQLTGTPSLFPLICLQYYGIGLLSSVKSYQNDSVTCFLYVLIEFCILSGELPMSIIKMMTNGLKTSLCGNIGFTLPSKMGELNIEKLDLSNCSLTGMYSYVDI